MCETQVQNNSIIFILSKKFHYFIKKKLLSVPSVRVMLCWLLTSYMTRLSGDFYFGVRALISWWLSLGSSHTATSIFIRTKLPRHTYSVRIRRHWIIIFIFFWILISLEHTNYFTTIYFIYPWRHTISTLCLDCLVYFPNIHNKCLLKGLGCVFENT